ncbi:endo-1,4-beta-xylanase [Carboxylicivirga sp. RSCT41]|uniref:endo-1,4-beta-xylanase n=1 Tax=Carboxylicivirga agarovorans TaxID=3417570 RepID=UPI003D32C306
MKQLNNILLLILIAMVTLACGSGDATAPTLDAPLALNATDITQNSFTAKWVGVANAKSYQIDVSTANNFSSFVDGFEAKSVSDVKLEVSSLDANTDYFYRVRAVNGETLSANSMTITTRTTIPEDVPLKEAAQSFFIGNVVQSNRMTGTHKEILNREYSSITAEYEMKMNIMYPYEGAYDWTRSDAIVDFAVTNNLNLHGHALIWHNSTPDWIENYTGTDAEFEAMLEDYVKTVVTRYKGKVKSWDVVNEAIEDGSGDYRNSVFYQRMGADYIAKCFKWAREADEDVLLFYNDYNLCDNGNKLTAVLNMIDGLTTGNVPINGLGFQMHISYNWPDRSDIEAAAQKVVDRKLKLHFSELDIRANPNNDLTSLSSARSLELKAKYKEIAEVYTAIPNDNKYALTIWGMKDNESWLLDFWGHIDWPLLYDSNFDEKDAYYGFLEGLMK